MSFERKWLEEVGSEDAHGRAIWGLGMTIRTDPELAIRSMASRLFMDCITCVDDFQSPRAIAFSLIGMHHYLQFYTGDSIVRKIRIKLVEKLFDRFTGNSSEEWPWPENILTYANAILPHSLFQAGYDLNREEMFNCGLNSLKWLLIQETSDDGHISVIGNREWMERDGTRARFAQQPVEVLSLVEACAEAFNLTKEKNWLLETRRCFDWFLGKNDLNMSVYEFGSGACYDGIEANCINENTGAESTLSFLISLLTMHELYGHRMLMKDSGDSGKASLSLNETTCN
jgi:hypothetical protein